MGMKRVTGPNGLVQYVDDGEEEQASPEPSPAAPAPRTAYTGTKDEWLVGQGYQQKDDGWHSPGGEFLSNNPDGIEPGMWDHARNPHSQIVPGQYDAPLTPQQAQASVAGQGSRGRPAPMQGQGQSFQQQVNAFAQKYGNGAQVYGAPASRPQDAGGSVPAGGGTRIAPAPGAAPPPPPPPPPPPVGATQRSLPGAAPLAPFSLPGASAPAMQTAMPQTALPVYTGATGAPGAAPAGEDFAEQARLMEYLDSIIQNANPYTSEVVAKQREQTKAELAQSRKQGARGVAETMAARGVLGGTPEEVALGDLEERLALIESGREADLLDKVANAEMQSRSLGASVAQGLLGFNEGRRQFDTNVGLQRESQALQKYGIDVGASLQQQSLALQKLGLDRDEAYRYTQLDTDGRLRARALELSERGMALDESFRKAELEQRQQGLDLQRYSTEQDVLLRDRALQLQREGMSADQAYRQAELDLRDRLGTSELGLREKEYDAARRRQEFLEDMGILEWMERTQSGAPAGNNDPSGWPRSLGKSDGERKQGSDGRYYLWDGSNRRWVPDANQK